MKYTPLLTSLFLLTLCPLQSQSVILQGHAKITEVDKDNNADSVVVRLDDGQLAVRDVGSFPDSDPANEIQILSVHGDTIFISSGNYIVLPGLSKLNTLLSVQERLNGGESPLEIVNSGTPVDSLFGKIYQGGLIFFLDINDDLVGLDGMVAAPYDLHAGGDYTRPWGCAGTIVGTAIELGTGKANTENIILNGCVMDNDAAKLADDYNDGTFSDWYLPSRDELAEMYSNIGPGAPFPNTNIGDFPSGGPPPFVYWSSSENGPEYDWASWVVDFSNGNQLYHDKATGNRIRPVRNF